jgi:dihydropteroate synthase
MADYNEGSALPRGLSSVTTPYLSSVRGHQDIYRLALREGGEPNWFEATRREILDWCAGESDPFRQTIEDQFGNLDRHAAAMSNSAMPRIMGILNVTPDSFSDGGENFDVENAVERATQMVEEGAEILDIGGESTRPGADAVHVEEEIQRIIPVIEGCKSLNVEISVDTRKEPVMAAAVAAGATMINDVSALEYDPRSLDFIASSGLPVCLMHSSADPKVMQLNPQYRHVLLDVIDFLKSRIEDCEAAGIDRNRIMVDPGIGFGKTVDHNLILIKGLPYLQSLGCNILLGASRKSFIGRLSADKKTGSKIGGSIATALYGVWSGVHMLRVHDVAETRQAVKLWQSIDSASF